MEALAHVTDSKGKVPILYPGLYTTLDDPKTSFYQHQALTDEILPHFDVNSVFRYGGTRSRDQQQGKGPYTHCKVVKMTPKQV